MQGLDAKRTQHYFVVDQECYTASRSDFLIDVEGTGFHVMFEGQVSGVKLRVGGSTADKIPVYNGMTWIGKFKGLWLTHDASGQIDLTGVNNPHNGRIIFVVQETGDMGIFPVRRNMIMIESHMTKTATSSWQAINFYTTKFPRVTVQCQETAGQPMNYRIYTTLYDGTVTYTQDVNSTCSANTSVTDLVDHAVNKVRFSYQRNGAVDAVFNVHLGGLQE